jgi:mono/diheme cytochrome c family protein
MLRCQLMPAETPCIATPSPSTGEGWEGGGRVSLGRPLFGRRRKFFLTVTLALVTASVSVQSQDKPGPMQSGAHSGEKAPSDSPPSATKPADPNFDVNKLFANSCGWCHAKGGREAGKGPQLMGTSLTDAEIINRIKNGKPGQMPAFGSAFDEAQTNAIVGYIRNLKPGS